nr:MAG: RNA-dependent RNA polymerase [Tibet bird virus 2]
MPKVDLGIEHSHFINQIINKMEDSDWKHEHTLEEQIRLASRFVDESEDKNRKGRRDYKRIKASPNDDERIQFAKVGVQGKDNVSMPEVSEYRKMKKDSFAWRTNTDDIDSFISCKEYSIDPAHERFDPVEAKIEQNILKALEAHESYNPYGIDFLRKAEDYYLTKYCRFLTHVGVELSISIKQNVNHDEWVVKKMRHYPCIMIIKPTNSTSHIFVKLLYPKSSIKLSSNSVFKDHSVGESLLSSDWVSYNMSSLVSLVKAESFILSMYAQWNRFLGFSEGLEGFDQPEFWKLCKISLLVHLEDKHHTEEMMTLMRYICMDKFSCIPINKYKMLNKFPTIFRSRLQLWAAKKLLTLMDDAKYRQAIEEEGDNPREGDWRLPELEYDLVESKTVHWMGMINPYTRCNLDHPQQLVELFYMGYATNKDASSWPNTDFKLVNKIAKYEDLLSDVEEVNLGSISQQFSHKFKFHEWSRVMIIAAADQVVSLLERVHGENQKDIVYKNFLLRLSRWTWESFSTLKASSTFDPNKQELLIPEVGGVPAGSNKKEQDRKKDKKQITHRMKVLIAVLRKRNLLADTPARSLKTILDTVNARGGLHIDIFKKNQHGGLREIYVMDLYSRVIQLSLEELSRAICEDLPSEMMMHPENKVKKPQEHMYKSAIEKTKFKCNMSSSNDARVWNQAHHVKKFCQFMLRITHKELHGLIIVGLKQWTTKKIKLPDGVVSTLRKHPDLKMHDTIDKKIVESYLGIQKTTWLEKGKNYLTVETGMMQGILHFMSSLFHTGMLMLRDRSFANMMRSAGIKFISTDLVSSDDSSRLVDVYAPTRRELVIGRGLSIRDQLCIDEYSTAFGIYMSPKSTYCTPYVVEFNSEFIFRSNLIRPTLKWAYSCLYIPECESLMERQELGYNLISELLEGGSGFTQAHLSQLAQAKLHYTLMGSSVNPLFISYTDRLSRLPDPALGFFLLDNPRSAGLPGVQYNLWKVMMADRNLNCLYKHLFDQGNMTTTTVGTLTRGAQVRYGNRQKMRKLLKEVNEAVPDWRENIELDPSILYRAPRTIQDAMMKLAVKLTSPSVIQSLTKGNVIARVMASSVYLMTGMSTTIGSNWQDAINSSSHHKTSLWNLLVNTRYSDRTLLPDEILHLFPHALKYESLQETFKVTNDMVLVNFGSRKSLRSHIPILPLPTHYPYSLEKMIRWKWFCEVIPATTSYLNTMWDKYRVIFPWLRDSPHETIQNPDCHFETQIQLRNFIARQSGKSRSLHLTGTPVRDTRVGDILEVVLSKNQRAGWTLISPGGSVKTTNLEDKIVSNVAGLLTFPYKKYVKVDRVINYLNSKPPMWDGEELRPRPRILRLAIIQEFIKVLQLRSEYLQDNSPFRLRELDRTERYRLTDLIRKSRSGVIGGFKDRQQFDQKTGQWHGRGSWQGCIGDAIVHMAIDGSTLVSIVTNNLRKLQSSEKLLMDLLKDFKIGSCRPYLGDEHTFNLKKLNRINDGAVVLENQSLGETYCLNLALTRIEVMSNCIRVKSSHQRSIADDSEYVVCSFSSQMWDHKFIKDGTLKSITRIEESWLSNTSLEPNIALGYLDKGLTSLPSNMIDTEEWRKFVQFSLMPSLGRQGFHFGALLTDYHIPLEEEINYDIMWEDSDGDDAEDDTAKIEIMHSVDLDYEILGLTDSDQEMFNIDDVVSGLMPLESTRFLHSDIRRIHKIWDRLTESIDSNLSRSEKCNFNEKVLLVSSTGKNLMKISEHYFNTKFYPRTVSEDLVADPDVDF